MAGMAASPGQKRAQAVAGLRALAALLENDSVMVPFDIQVDVFWADGQDRLTSEHARDAMAASPGGWSKELIGNYVVYRKDLSATVSYHLNLDREHVCRKVQTGVRHVPATEARDEPVYDWVCE